MDAEKREAPDRSWVEFTTGLRNQSPDVLTGSLPRVVEGEPGVPPRHDALLEGTRRHERGRELARARQFLLDNGHPDTGPTWDDWVDQVVEDLLAAIHGEE